MAKHLAHIRKWVRWVAPNAIWDLVKWIGGSSMMTSIGRVFWLEYHRSPVDWWWLVCLMGAGLLLVVVGAWHQQKSAAPTFEANGVVPTLPSHPGFDVGAFKPLQIEAMQLSIGLLKLVRRLGPEPTPKYSEYDINVMPEAQRRHLLTINDKDFRESCEYHFGEANAHSGGPMQTAEQLHASLMAHYRLFDPWYERVKAAFALECEADVERIRNRFIVEGISDDQILLTPREGREGVGTIKTMAAKLWEMTYKAGERVIENENV